MQRDKTQTLSMKKSWVSSLLFPFCVVAFYGILFLIAPEQASMAVSGSLRVFRNIMLPLFLVFLVMTIFNLFLNPAQIARFLGKTSGIQGISLSAAAGILSMGPIYAWYPMLKQIRKKGAGNSPIAIFLGTRAVKPFLLPMMISYFGWVFVLALTICIIMGSVLVGYLVGMLVEGDG